MLAIGNAPDGRLCAERLCALARSEGQGGDLVPTVRLTYATRPNKPR